MRKFGGKRFKGVWIIEHIFEFLLCAVLYKLITKLNGKIFMFKDEYLSLRNGYEGKIVSITTPHPSLHRGLIVTYTQRRALEQRGDTLLH